MAFDKEICPNLTKNDHHEMNLVAFRMAKTVILIILETPNFDILENFILKNIKNCQKIKFIAAVIVSIAQMGFPRFS